MGTIGIQPPETDLRLPTPGDEETWDPHTIHTHYFGFSVPEADIGAFIYVRYHPAFPLCGGGVCIFRGLDNVSLLDMDYLDYELTMPWPEIDGNTITTANGLRIEFLEPGREARVSYENEEGNTSFDFVATAVTPLLARGHVMPGEDLASDPGLAPGGMEQLVQCKGELVLNGERHEIDCHEARDRSWSQLRAERRGTGEGPPVGWSPMYFDDTLSFNQIGFEPLDTDPAWQGVYEVAADRPTHHWGWVHTNGETRSLARVRRNVLEYHPQLHGAVKQEIEAEDDAGERYRFAGEAIAMAAVPAWPNVSALISVFRWEDDQGRVTHGTFQEIGFAAYQQAMKERSRARDLSL